MPIAEYRDVQSGDAILRPDTVIRVHNIGPFVCPKCQTTVTMSGNTEGRYPSIRKSEEPHPYGSYISGQCSCGTNWVYLNKKGRVTI